MKAAALAALAALAACATAEAPPPPPVPRQVPPGLIGCPGPVVVPPAPRAPRTVEAVGAWGTRIDAALVRSEAARAECSRRLATLNRWIEENP